MADEDKEPREIEGEPKDPESPLKGAQFGSVDGEPSRTLPKKKPPADRSAEPDQPKAEEAPAATPDGFNPEVPPTSEPPKPASLPSKPEMDQAKPDQPEKKQSEAEKKPDDKARPQADDDGSEDLDRAEGASSHMVMTPRDEESETGKELVLFDFDGTLIEQDSLDLLLQEMAGGWLASRFKFLSAVVTAFLEAIFTRDDYMDYRSALKAHWMINTLKDQTVEAVQEASRRVAKRLNWRDKLKDAISRYAGEGREVVVATGAIDLCIKILLEGLPVTCLICTHAEVEDGKLTGRMAGTPKNAVNVVRGEKRYRVQRYIEERGPYKRVVGYGNMPDDGPMLSLCDEFFIV